MKKLIITDEIIEKEMIKMGLPTDGDKLQDEEFVQQAVLKYYDVTITNDFRSNLDYYVYPESTADGYEVFIATHDDRNISVNEHIHYYDSNLATELEDFIRSSGGYCTIYVADDFIDEYWYSDMFTSIYQSICEIQEQEIKDTLIDEGYIETTD